MTHSQRVSFLQLDYTMQSGRSFNPIYLSVLTILAYFMYGAVPDEVVLVWCLSYLVYIAARTHSSMLYRKDSKREQPERVRHWRRIVTVSGAGHGAVLGSLAVIALPHLGHTEILLLTWSVMTVAVVGSIVTAPLLLASSAFMFTSVTPYIAAAVLSGGNARGPVGLILVVGCIIHLVLNRRYRAMADNGFRLLLSNEDLARELEAKIAALALANSSKARLIASASHDLRQPVHALGLMVERLADEVGPNPQWRTLDSMKSAVGMASEMLTELMDWTRLGAANYEVDLQHVAVSRVFEEVRLVYGMSAANKGLSLDIEPTDAAVRSDRHLLRRMLLNLTSNAIKYTRHGSVRLACVASGSAYVTLSVIDSGMGIPRDKQQAIFEEFVRLGSGPENPEGLGIGLPIVRQAAQLLGHSLEVHDRPEGGTEFSIRCPSSDHGPLHANGAPTDSTALTDQVPTRVLVLENDHFSLGTMANLLEKWGFAPVCAPHLTGMQLQLAGVPADEVGLIIADYHLDDRENGLQAIGALREALSLPDLPALLVTGELEPSLPSRASAMDVVLLHKPLSPAQLRQNAQALVRGAAAR